MSFFLGRNKNRSRTEHKPRQAKEKQKRKKKLALFGYPFLPGGGAVEAAMMWVAVVFMEMATSLRHQKQANIRLTGPNDITLMRSLVPCIFSLCTYAQYCHLSSLLPLLS